MPSAGLGGTSRPHMRTRPRCGQQTTQPCATPPVGSSVRLQLLRRRQAYRKYSWQSIHSAASRVVRAYVWASKSINLLSRSVVLSHPSGDSVFCRQRQRVDPPSSFRACGCSVARCAPTPAKPPHQHQPNFRSAVRSTPRPGERPEDRWVAYRIPWALLT